jgi:hypothetical protein
MEVVLDGKLIKDDVSGNNLQEILHHLSQHSIGKDRALKEVLINGKPYEEDKFGLPQEVSRESIKRLGVQTISAREMALHFLTSADPTLNALIDTIEPVSEMLNAGDTQNANERYLQLLNTLQLFLQMVEQCNTILNLDLEGARLEEVTAKESLDRLSGLVEQMLEAQQQENWRNLADVMQYDLAPELQNWKKLLPLIARETR